jgi:hypothetical protein
MSEVRCPMCSKPNPDDAEACEFCGARIKPLFIEPDSEEQGVTEHPPSPPSEDRPPDESQEADWLNRMRGGIEDDEADQPGDQEPEQVAPERGSTDLLGRFKGLGLADDEEDRPDEISDTPIEEPDEEQAVEPAPERGSTDLLGRFKGLGLAPDDEQESEDIPDVPVDDQAEADVSVPGPERGSTDLLGRLSDLGLSESEEQISDEGPSEVTEEADRDADIEEPVWEDVPEPEVAVDSVEIPEEQVVEDPETEVPDWLTRIRERQTEEDKIEKAPTKDVDWISGLQEQAPPPEDIVSEPEAELEKTPPFIDFEAELDGIELGDPPATDPFVAEADFISELEDDSESLDDLFKDLEEEVAAVERIAAEDDEFSSEEDEASLRTELDDLFSEEVDDPLVEEIPSLDQDLPYEPIEIEKGTSPLQDLFEELDKELQTGELPSLEPEVITGPEKEEEVDAALEKLLEEFDDESIADAGFFADDALDEDEAKVDREIPLEEIFSDFQVTPSTETESPFEEIAEAEAPDTEEGVQALEDILDEIETPSEEEVDEFKGIFEGVEAPSAADIASFEDAFAEVEPISEEDAGSIEEAFADFEVPDDDGILPIDGPVSEVEPPDEVDIAAIEKLFGDFDAGPVEEAESEIDSGILRELTDETPPDKLFSEAAPIFDVPEEEGVDEPEVDVQFEAAEIEPESLAPGSDQLAAVFDVEQDEEGVEELLTTAPISPEVELPAPTEEELAGYTPSWLREGVSEEEISAEPDSDLPHVPALIMDEEELDAEELGADFLAAEVSMDDMPTWLQDLGADVDEEEIDEQPTLELAKAKLPPWLEAMRPIETFQAEPEIVEEEEEEITEAAGPLAGLRGVLLAEPVVAMPRSASTGVAALDITERHYTNTEILRQMISEEELELAKPEVRAVPLPIVRWIISLLLLLAVAVPTLLGFPTFKEPFLGPHELNPFLALMDSIPLGQPALIVFDYEPGFSPEVDAVAGAMVEDLIGRRQPIVSLSSRPTGPLLADRMILRVGSDRDLTNGVDYLHLGFLTGGSTGVQLFASSPRSSIVEGFRLPEEPENVSTWDTPILEEVQKIKDFSVIAVITSGTETARNWIEQLNPYLEDTPLVMVVSAGVEPMIRPYYETQDPQIQGILTGIQAGIKYEVRNGTLSDATQNWNAFGTAILLAELILIAGAIYGTGSWFLQRRLSAEE